MLDTDAIKDFINHDNPRLLVKTAEDIGNYLGVARAAQVTKIYHVFDNEFRKITLDSENLQILNSLLLLKPKMAFLVAKSSGRERPALERFHYALVQGIDNVLEIDGAERYERLKRLHQFIEAAIYYQQYAYNEGAKFESGFEVKKLQEKIIQLQSEMNKLLQFVAVSTKEVKVFLSHSYIDKPFVEQLKTDLEAKGITTWYDNKDLNIGDILSDAISQGVKQSWCFLIVVSSESIKSNWVKYELDEAYDRHIAEGKRILPVLIGNLTSDDIPQRLKKHVYADFRNKPTYKDVFEKLYRTIVREGVQKTQPLSGV